MIKTILTPDEAKSARASIGLSQNKVAQAIGISRTTLALFEVNKYLLDDASLNLLRQFYVDSGYEFAEEPLGELADVAADSLASIVRTSGVRLVDGFAIPAGIDELEVESILAEISENDRVIDDVTVKVPDAGWWGGESDTKGLDLLMRLHARNYMLVRRLQGDAWEIAEAANDENIEAGLVTNGMLFKAALQS